MHRCQMLLVTRHRKLLFLSCRWVFQIELPSNVRVELVDRMADVEYRLAFGTSEKLQLGALVGAFAQAAEQLMAAAK